MLLLLKLTLLVLPSRTGLSWLCNAGTLPSDGSHFNLLPAPGRASPSPRAQGGLCPARREVAWPLRAGPGLGPCTVPPQPLGAIVVFLCFSSSKGLK